MDNALPYDDATENVVLGSVIANTGEYEVVSRYFTDINVFHQKRASLLWLKIKEMKRSGQNVDTLTVCTSLTKKDIEYAMKYAAMEFLKNPNLNEDIQKTSEELDRISEDIDDENNEHENDILIVDEEDNITDPFKEVDPKLLSNHCLLYTSDAADE